MTYLKLAPLKTLARAHQRRLGRAFLETLDRHVEHKLRQACAVHNGGRVTLDATIAHHVGLTGGVPKTPTTNAHP